MDKTLETMLTRAGISGSALAVLEEQELATEAALKRGYTFAQFCAMGLKAGSARVLSDLFPPATTPASAAPVIAPVVTFISWSAAALALPPGSYYRRNRSSCLFA
jgi:hypothetical protein